MKYNIKVQNISIQTPWCIEKTFGKYVFEVKVPLCNLFSFARILSAYIVFFCPPFEDVLPTIHVSFPTNFMNFVFS